MEAVSQRRGRPREVRDRFRPAVRLWFVAGSLVRDVAARNKVELLPWDAWGAQPQPDETLDDDQLAFLRRAGRSCT
jgi:hypothetical protein